MIRKLILASASPRRRELLENAGIVFSVRVAGVDERRGEGETAAAYVRRLAEAKARAVERAEDEWVLGADTTVVVDHHILEKPTDAADARRMLALLAGRAHEVITGICLVTQMGVVVDESVTRVVFTPMSATEIDEYVASGEPFDKAGAYGIQGRASRFVERIEGCYFNVVGLPVSLVATHLARIGMIP
ncbi:MAG: Maf family protein [Bryobacteraceae bacterium]|nr:Maf family protein [Bryobacteraceae bacterium]